MGGWMGGWMEVKAGLRIAYSNQQAVKKYLAGWVGGWMDWWMEAKAWVRIVTAIIKPKMACCFKFKFLTIL